MINILIFVAVLGISVFILCAFLDVTLQHKDYKHHVLFELVGRSGLFISIYSYMFLIVFWLTR